MHIVEKFLNYLKKKNIRFHNIPHLLRLFLEFVNNSHLFTHDCMDTSSSDAEDYSMYEAN